MEYDSGAAARSFGRVDRRNSERAFPVGRPERSLRSVRAPRDDVHAAGYHKGGVEADAELTDELRALSPLRLVSSGCLEPLHKRLGAGPRDSAEPFHHLIAAHADAVVLD